MIWKNFDHAALVLSVIFSLSACSSGGDAGTTVAGGGRGGTEYGFLTLGITDAPIDNATEVRVQFDGVELMPSSDTSEQDTVLIMFDEPMRINLLDSQGLKSQVLLSNEILPTGSYNWLKLKITAANDGVLDSYITLADGTVHELDLPSGDEVGLQITDGVEVIANTSSAKTIIFDLRKSVIMTDSGDFNLQPTLNIVNNNESGSIVGMINSNVLTSSECSDTDPSTGNAFYLFEGKNVKPDDIDGIDAEPFATTLVTLDTTTGDYHYSFDYVPFGDYTATFTCKADLEDPATDDAISFTKTKNIQIRSTVTKTINENIFSFKMKGPSNKVKANKSDD
jgi:hypothetical protein